MNVIASVSTIEVLLLVQAVSAHSHYRLLLDAL